MYTWDAKANKTILGVYVTAVMRARQQLGIPDKAWALTTQQDYLVRQTVDRLLLERAEQMTMPVITEANGQIDNLTRNAILREICEQAGCILSASNHNGGYDNLNEEEQRVCRNEPYDCERSRETPDRATMETMERYPEGGYNDEGDAFRHCFWSALMTKRANAGFAERFGNAHEDGDDDQPPEEAQMDKHNNAVGRDIGVNDEGADDEITANNCQQAARDGRLQLAPY